MPRLDHERGPGRLLSMLLVAVIPLLVCVAGALIYALATNSKLVEMGRLAFFAGLFVFLLFLGGESVTLRLGR